MKIAGFIIAIVITIILAIIRDKITGKLFKQIDSKDYSKKDKIITSILIVIVEIIYGAIFIATILLYQKYC